jgi:nicotinate-nucleotide adenylyltransferase
MKKIILFGGSFDPIHNGHLMMAQKALEKFTADKVIFITNNVSVWKDSATSPLDKYQMVRLALEKHKKFTASKYELNRVDNYTINTVKHFKKMYPNEELFFLIGADQVNEFHHWREAKEISKLVKIIFYQRKDIKLNTANIENFDMQAVEGPEIDVSSTDVRTLKKPNTPYKVLDYIQRKNLYYMKDIEKYIDGGRLLHSESVALLAYKIALKNGIKEPYKAYIAGLLHDIGKNINKEIEKKIEEQYSSYLPIDKKLYHQFNSLYIAKEKFGIKDKAILDAIEYHATGHKSMNPIAMIVYASDKIDPNRGYDSSKMIKAMMENYAKGFIYVLRENRKHLIAKGRDINNKLTKECMDEYLK